MISNYEIKSIQGTELLFIYLDNNYEFAKINSSKDKRNLKKQILDFIKKNNIKFKGTTIALVTSGLIIGIFVTSFTTLILSIVCDAT